MREDGIRAEAHPYEIRIRTEFFRVQARWGDDSIEPPGDMLESPVKHVMFQAVHHGPLVLPVPK
jgi:hypothetical protein